MMERPKNDAPDRLDDLARWRRIGGRLGQTNRPMVGSADLPVRDALRAVWTAELNRERRAFLDELDAVDARRGDLVRRSHEVRAQAATDPRLVSAVQVAVAAERELGRQRTVLHERFLQVVGSLTGRAAECDAAWRSENERQRDRRLAVSPTEFVFPAGLLDLPPDPHG